MKKLLKRFKENKKGFTLVEVIVVLVILAILAAAAIPAMTGWIKKANDRAALAEARTLLLAAQTVTSENFYVDPSNIKLGDAGEGTDKDEVDTSTANGLAGNDLTLKIEKFAYNKDTGKVVYLKAINKDTEAKAVVVYYLYEAGSDGVEAGFTVLPKADDKYKAPTDNTTTVDK